MQILFFLILFFIIVSIWKSATGNNRPNAPKGPRFSSLDGWLETAGKLGCCFNRTGPDGKGPSLSGEKDGFAFRITVSPAGGLDYCVRLPDELVLPQEDVTLPDDTHLKLQIRGQTAVCHDPASDTPEPFVLLCLFEWIRTVAKAMPSVPPPAPAVVSSPEPVSEPEMQPVPQEEEGVP